MAIERWQPAPEGSGWERLNAAWEVLHALVMAAAKECEDNNVDNRV